VPPLWLQKTRLDKVHAKSVVVDGDKSLVSSINWGRYAAIYNREVGLIVENEEVGGFFTEVFEHDWGKSSMDPEDVSDTTPKGRPPFEEDAGGNKTGAVDPAHLWVTGAAIVFIIMSVVVMAGLAVFVPMRREYWGTGAGPRENDRASLPPPPPA
jgi:phosphatidylserine/phosphatidylglycerophosphate/cardiolipin synthase-like enzyme